MADAAARGDAWGSASFHDGSPSLASRGGAPAAAPGVLFAAVPPRAPPIPAGRRADTLRPTVSYVLGMGAQSTFFFFLAPAATREMGHPEWDVVVFTLSAVATMLVAFAAGRLSDIHGRRPVMRAGWWIMAAGALLLIPPLLGAGPGSAGAGPLTSLTALAWILASTTLVGAGLALSFVAFMSYLADVNRASHEAALLANRLTGAPRASALAKSYGISSAGAVLASALGPFAAGIILALAPTAGLGLVFVALLLALFGTAAALLSYTFPAMRQPGQPGAAPPAEWLRFLRPPRREGDRGVWAINVLTLILGASFGVTGPYFAGYFLDDVGVAPESWALILGVGTAVGAFAVLGSGLLAGTERIRAAPYLLAIGGVTALTLVPFAFTVGVAAATILYILRSIVCHMPGPVMNGVLMVSADEESRGGAMGASYFLWNLGWGAGALAGGLLVPVIGSWIFPVGGVLALVAVAAGTHLLPPATGIENVRAHVVEDAGRMAQGAGTESTAGP